MDRILNNLLAIPIHSWKDLVNVFHIFGPIKDACWEEFFKKVNEKYLHSLRPEQLTEEEVNILKQFFNTRMNEKHQITLNVYEEVGETLLMAESKYRSLCIIGIQGLHNDSYLICNESAGWITSPYERYKLLKRLSH